jgi:acetoin utilization protein AcuB
MARRPTSIGPDADMREAKRLAEASGTRHLLVLDQGVLVGILCLCDLREAAGSVADHMSLPVLTIRADATVEDAADTMRQFDVGCLPVVMGGLILGTVTEEEISPAEPGRPGRFPHCACHPRARRRV